MVHWKLILAHVPLHTSSVADNVNLVQEIDIITRERVRN